MVTDERTAAQGGVLRDDARLIAFYLPQFHRIAENSEWWGPGFTEWTNVAGAKPNFEGHDQPKIPRELGFYDLSHVEVLREQAELARLYGVHGFCFYHYWFSGRRILEKPVENFLASDIDMPFCLCWANENWTRSWDGDTKSVLLEQKYLPGDDERFIAALIPALRDPRYIQVDGKPLLIVYRAKAMPRPAESFAIWRQAATAAGFAGLHIAAVDMHDMTTPGAVGADALVEFPPHRFSGPKAVPDQPPEVTNPDFTGNFVDYTKIIAQSAAKSAPAYRYYRGIMPSWDNSARRQDNSTIVVNARPALYGAWLRYLRAFTRHHATAGENLIFVNAWNEWGEGCMLEPDRRWGLANLEETFRSMFREAGADENLDQARQALYRSVADLMANSARGDESAEAQQALSKRIAAEMANYRPQSDVVQNLSARLRKWPRLHGLIRAVYRLTAKLGN